MELSEVLISTNGDFILSDEFSRLHLKKTGKHMIVINRSDLELIEIFKELGSASSPSNLTLVKIPTVFKNFIEIRKHTSCETIYINKDRAFAQLLHDFMTGDFTKDVLDKRYDEMLTISQNRMIFYNRN
jgi:hypothetical protein